MLDGFIIEELRRREREKREREREGRRPGLRFLAPNPLKRDVSNRLKRTRPVRVSS